MRPSILLSIPFYLVVLPAFGQDVEKFQENNKWGVKDEHDKIIVAASYDAVETYDYDHNSKLIYVKLNDKWGVVNGAGKLILPIEYDKFGVYSEGLLPASKGGKYGYIDLNGKVKIDFQFEMAHGFAWGFASVFNNNMEGIIDNKGNTILPIIYSTIDDMDSGNDILFKIANNGKFGIANTKGEILCAVQYDDMGGVSEDLIYAKKDGYYGYIDRNGNIKLPFQYENTDGFYHGITMVYQNNKAGMINTKGEFIVPAIYDYIGYDSHLTSLIVLKDQKYALFSAEGKQLTEFLYDYINEDKAFEKFIVPEVNKKMGFMTVEGKLLLPCEYDGYEETDYDFAIIKKNGKVGTLNTKTGEIILATEYDYISPEGSSEHVIIQKEDKYGLVTPDSKTILYQLEYKYIEDNYDGSLILQKDTLFGLGNYKGEIIVEISFKDIYKADKDRYEVTTIQGEKYHVNSKGKRIK